MCLFASMVVTKGFKVFWSKTNDSHSAIRREFDLPENGIGQITNVQIEYIPNNGTVSKKQSDWEFRVDQDKLPDWWNIEEAKAACWAVLPEMCKARGRDMFKRRVRIPDGYERCPDDHVLRRGIDLGPAYMGSGDVEFNDAGKKAYKNFQWVQNWGGRRADMIKTYSGLRHFICVRPKTK